MDRINLKFIILVIISYIYARFQGRALAYSMFYIIFLTFLASLISVIAYRFLLNIKINIENNIYNCGDKINVELLVSNKSIFPVPYVIIKGQLVSLYNSKFEGEVANLKAFENKTFRYPIIFKKRGIYNLGQVDLFARDLFCMFRIHRKINKDLQLKVYPNIYDFKEDFIVGFDIFKNNADAKSFIEDMHSAKDMRQYRDGDNLKRINWKVSAKYNELFVRNFDKVSSEELNIFLDMNIDNYNMDLEGIIEEKIIDFCCSIINLSLNKNIKSKVYINCKDFHQVKIICKEDFENFMEFLLERKSDSIFNFGEFINCNRTKVAKASTVAILTSKITEALSETLIEMKDSGYRVVLFYVGKNGEDDSLKEFLNKIGVRCFNIFDIIKS